MCERESLNNTVTFNFFSIRLKHLDSILQPISFNFTVNRCTSYSHFEQSFCAHCGLCVFVCAHKYIHVYLSVISFIFPLLFIKENSMSLYVFFILLFFFYDCVMILLFLFFIQIKYIYACWLMLFFCFLCEVFAHLSSENGYLDT